MLSGRLPLLAVLAVAFAASTAVAQADRADAEFDFANTLADNGLSDLALIVYENAVKEFKDHERVEEALVSIADMKLALGRRDEAVQAYKDFLKKHGYSKYAMRAQFGIGAALYEKEDYKGALKQFRYIFDNDKDTASDSYIRAAYNIAWCQYKLGKYEEAAKGFQEFAVVYAGLDLAVDAWLALGECRLKMGKPADAIYAFRKARSETKDPETIMRATYGLGRASFECKNYTDAKLAFTDLLKRAGNTEYAPLAMYWLGLTHTTAGDRQKGMQTLNDLMQKYPDSYYAKQALDKLAEWARGSSKWLLTEAQRFALAMGDYEKGNYEVAKAKFEALLVARPKGEYAAKAARAIARCLHKLGKTKEAAQALLKAAADYPQDPVAPECLVEAASLFSKANDVAGRKEALAKLAKDYPNFGKGDRIKFTLAGLLFTDGKYEEAARAYLEIPKAFPKSDLAGRALFHGGYSLYLAGKYEEAAKALDSFLKSYPKAEERPQALYFKGDALQQLGKTADAKSAFRLCLQSSPKAELAAAAHFQLGLISEKEKHLEEAAKEYDLVVAACPKAEFAPAAKLRSAMALFQLKKTDESRAKLLELIRDSGDLDIPAGTLDWLAESLLRINDLDNCEKVCRKVIERFADDPEASTFVEQSYYRLGKVYMKQGKWREACNAFGSEGLLGKFPKSMLMPQATLNMADALVNLREYDRAILLLQDLAAAARGDLSLEVQYKIATIFELQGKNNEAARVLERATILPGKLQSNNWLIRTYEKLGEIKEILGDKQGAISAYDEAIKLETVDPELLKIKDKARNRKRALQTL